ncbi:DUF177 domain-containing protein [Candidatus Omnitrophota bacterium]
MKIHVDEVPAEGLELTEALDPHEMLLDLEMQGVSFTEAIDIKTKVTKIGVELFMDVAMESPVEYTCARCLTKFQDVFKKKFNVSHEIKPGDILDVDEDIRQEMILDYPMKVVCKADCKGLCPNCGQNLNVSMCECK